MAFFHIRKLIIRKYGIISTNLLQNNRYNVKLLSFQSISTTLPKNESKETKATENKPETKKREHIDTTFNNAKISFKSRTTWELVRAYTVYTICSVEYCVENCMKLMKVGQTILGKTLFGMLMKATFYGHFVAGEDEVRIVPCLERLHSFGVKPILDYSVEEDITQEEAETREVDSSTSKAGTTAGPGPGATKQFQVEKNFADRRNLVQSARTYFYINEAQCEKNMELFIKCIKFIADYDKKSARSRKSTPSVTFGSGITAVKLTALGRPQLLMQLSEVIMRTRQYISELDGGTGNVLGHHMKTGDLEKKLADKKVDACAAKSLVKNVTSDDKGILHLFPWSELLDENHQLNEAFKVPDLKTGQKVNLMTQLTPHEEEMFRNMIRRLNTIFTIAQEMDSRIIVDAEQTYFQPAITRITLEMMRKYNKEKGLIFNTYQAYLKNTFDEVQTDMEQAKRQDFYFGAKLVRGAYIEQERARAAAMGYPDPTNPDYEATTASYFKTLTEILQRIKAFKEKDDGKKVGIMVASHNEDTVRFALKQMEEIGILPEDNVVCFGQLLGMCDYMTFPLGQSGYSAYKYIPYGPVNEVLPYLGRRVIENRGVLQKIKKEKRLLLKEILRRFVTFQLWYTPKGMYSI